MTAATSVNMGGRVSPRLPAYSFMEDAFFAKKIFLISIWVFSLPFMYHAFSIGYDFASDGHSDVGAFTTQNSTIALYFIAWHMMLGASMNFLAPFQVYLGLTQQHKVWHRWLGVAVISIAIFGAIVGSLYFTLYQDVNFGTLSYSVFPVYQAGGMYGVVMFYIIFKCVQSLIQKNYGAHKEWAIRLMIVAVGSWLSRIITGWVVNLYVSADLLNVTVPVSKYVFQIANPWAFYVVPLAIYEVYVRLKRSGKTADLPKYAPFVASLTGIFILGGGTVGYLVQMYMKHA